MNIRTAITFKGLSLLLAVAGLGCQNALSKAARETKYSAWELVGVQKRDLFKRQVAQTKEGQAETGEAFQDALDNLQQVYKLDGGQLEREYRKLNSSYETAEQKVAATKTDVTKLETLSKDLFEEWAKEIEQMQSKDLKAKSAASLKETKSKHAVLFKDLKNAEAKMGPVLAKLRDHVLYLKHNLNAKAVASLKNESLRIESEISSLIEEMNKSIASADQVIKNLN